MHNLGQEIPNSERSIYNAMMVFAAAAEAWEILILFKI